MSATCSNCGEPHDANDVFCESCGLDFVAGTLPEPEAPVTSLGRGAQPRPPGLKSETPSGEEDAADQVLVVSCDISFHQRMAAADLLTYPDPEPDDVVVTIVGNAVLVGRERPSRGVFPDVDLSRDPAVSSRHAMFRRRADGQWTVTDLGSTNGTYVGDSTVPIAPDVPVPVSHGTAVYVGAWTRIELMDSASAA